MKVVIDFEGYFSSNKRFFFKEICFFNYDTLEYQNFFIKSNKINYSKNYQWLFSFLHLIPFNYGKTKYSFIKLIWFNNPHIEFIVKSEDKKNILINFTKNKITSLDIPYNISYLTIPPNKSECQLDNHNHNINFSHCSLKKVKKLVYYINEYEAFKKAFES
jgi:hypothetical protein